MDQIMETITQISGYTVKQMLLYFFEQHKDGEYSALFITGYLWDTFELKDPNKPFKQLRNEVSSNFSTFYSEQDHRERNFDRYQDPSTTREQFIYYYVPCPYVGLPDVILKLNPPKPVKYNIHPKQQSLRSKVVKDVNAETNDVKTETSQLCLNMFIDDLQTIPDKTEQPEIEEPTMQEEEEMPPLIQDIRNAEMLTEIESDKLQYHLEQLIALLPPNCPEIMFKKNAYNKMYSFTLTEEA